MNPTATSRRIAYLVNQYPQPTQTFIRREIRALERLGWDVHRVTVRRWPGTLVDPVDGSEAERTRAILAAGLPRIAGMLVGWLLSEPARFAGTLHLAIRLGWRSDTGVLRHLAYLCEAAVLAAWLARDSLPHVHAHFGTNSTTVALLAAHLSRRSFSFTVHGPEEFDKPESLKLSDKIRHASFVVAISEYARSQLLRWADPADWDKISVVRCPAGTDSLTRSSSAPPPTEPRLLNVGRIAPEKGQLLLVAALKELADTGVPFECTILGDGPLRPVLERRIQSLGLSGRIRLPGWASNQEVQKQLSAARALVSPSLAEGLPVVLIEALALGRPVVATSVAGIPELVIPEQNGWLIPPGRVAELAEALRAVLAAPASDLERRGANGRARVAQLHDDATEASRLAALFSAAGPPARASLRARAAERAQVSPS